MNQQNYALYRGVVVICLTFCLSLSISSPPAKANDKPQSTPTPTSAIPPRLPSYFALGLKSDELNKSWMPASGVPWNYRYQYLNVGWENWNSPAGQVVTNYIQYSSSIGCIPVFDWYLAGSQRNLTNLPTPSFMNTYFASWKLMLQKAGAFSSPVIVHVEPDMWSFMQQQRSQDPTTITVSVASSGFSEVASFANNASGFAKALIALRNTYAPNVLLAWDNSGWAVNYDPISNAGNPATFGGYVAGFYQKLSASFDLIFFNMADADAGYKVAVWGQTTAQAWWTDTAFDRFRQYIAAVTQATGVKGMLWQIPVGNTLYRSCNNTAYHYQDNHVEYFLQSGNRQRIIDYANAGIIGILYGDGQDTDTSYWDSAGDGIINPAAINGNTLDSTSSDDDGGFLRTSAAAYYSSGPVPVP